METSCQHYGRASGYGLHIYIDKVIGSLSFPSILYLVCNGKLLATSTKSP
jgi:hypothetical protein